MKMLKCFAIAIMFVGFACTATAQSKNLIFKAEDGTKFNYGKQAILRTSDSALHAIATIAPLANEAGVLEVTTVGFDSTNAIAVTGIQVVRYKKVAGTLTLGTPVDVLATVTDGSLGTATWDIVASSNNIAVRVKGKLNIVVKWAVNIRLLARSRSSTPTS